MPSLPADGSSNHTSLLTCQVASGGGERQHSEPGLKKAGVVRAKRSGAQTIEGERRINQTHQATTKNQSLPELPISGEVEVAIKSTRR